MRRRGEDSGGTISPAVKPVLRPACRVVEDIFLNAVQVALVADDVIMVTALPERVFRRMGKAVNAFAHGGFESAHNDGQRSGNGVGKGMFYRVMALVGIGRGMARHASTLDKDHPMKMIGHDHKGIQGHIGAGCLCMYLFLMRNLPVIIENHIPIDHRSKQVSTSTGAKGHKVSTRLGVVIPF